MYRYLSADGPLNLTEDHYSLVEHHRSKAAAGCMLRIAVADPECEKLAERDEEEGLGGTLAARVRTALRYLDPLRECGGVEFRHQSIPMYNSIFRFDADMLVTPHLYARPGRLSPLLHLRRRHEAGILENFLTH